MSFNIKIYRSKDYAPIRNFFRDKIHTAVNSEITYRTLNHWTSMGLIRDTRKLSSSWRKLSYVDLILIELFVSLRKYGVSLNYLQAVSHFIYNHDDVENTETLELDLMNCLQGEDVSYVFFPQGVHIPLYHSTKLNYHDFIRTYEIDLKADSHITVNLTSIVKRVFPSVNIKLTQDKKSDFTITAREEKLLEFLRATDSKFVRLKAHKGSLVVNAEKYVENNTDISKLLKENPNQELQVTVHKGEIVKVIQTKKLNLTPERPSGRK